MSTPPPFQEPTNPIIYVLIGILAASTAILIILYFKEKKEMRRAKTSDEKDNLRVNNIGLTKKAQDVLEKIMEDSELQSDLPDRLNVSKATISNAISELFERNLIIKKKRANTYLIEPNLDEIKKEQR